MQSNEKTNLSESVPETSRGKAYYDLIQAGVTPEKVPLIRRKLTNAYALLGEIKTASEQKRGKTKAQLEVLVSGKILKKYRGMKYISNETKLNRHRLAKVKSKQLTPNRRQRLVDHQERMRKLVQGFLSRDDNSRILQGKNDIKKNQDSIMQPKRTLTDYLESLHQKLCMENSQIKISRATVCRYQPTHIRTVSFALRRT